MVDKFFEKNASMFFNVFSVASELYLTVTPLNEHLLRNNSLILGEFIITPSKFIISPLLFIVSVHSSFMIFKLGSLSNVIPKYVDGVGKVKTELLQSYR